MFTNFTCHDIDDTHTLVEGKCIVTGKSIQIKVRMQSLDDYYNHGMKAQDAFPELTPGQREFFISGISDEGWNRVVPADE